MPEGPIARPLDFDTIRAAVRQELTEAGYRRIDQAIQDSITESIATYSQEVEEQVKALASQHREEMNAEIAASKERMNRRKWTVLMPLAHGLAVIAVLVVAAWGFHQWTTVRLRTSIAALTEVEERIAGARDRLERIEGQTWGVDLVVTDGRCLVLLPENLDVDTHLRFDGRRAAELPCPAGALND